MGGGAAEPWLSHAARRPLCETPTAPPAGARAPGRSRVSERYALSAPRHVEARGLEATALGRARDAGAIRVVQVDEPDAAARRGGEGREAGERFHDQRVRDLAHVAARQL